jgi:hypothetical protein
MCDGKRFVGFELPNVNAKEEGHVHPVKLLGYLAFDIWHFFAFIPAVPPSRSEIA